MALEGGRHLTAHSLQDQSAIPEPGRGAKKVDGLTFNSEFYEELVINSYTIIELYAKQ